MTDQRTGALSIQDTFEAQSKARWRIAQSSARDRRQKLKALERALFKYRPALREAMAKDFSKPAMDVDLSEIFVVLKEIRHARKNLRKWMAPTHVATPISLIGTRSKILFEPKGQVLIISPWNFPVNLTFGPLVAAIAAGNTIILKPSEFTPNTSGVMKQMVEELFDPSEVSLFIGDGEVAKKLTALPFNHIFFTGGPETGQKVQRAALENHTSVTLELGGKTPAIVHESADIGNAAKRIAWGKFVNGGQICIAPDHVLVHEKVKDAFVAKLKKEVTSLFGSDLENSSDYCRMVSDIHFKRLEKLVNEASQDGAKVYQDGNPKSETRFFPPTLIENVSPNSRVMKEEIFGPVLPIIPFGEIEEACGQAQSHGKPLALYIFARNNKAIKEIVSHTQAGSTAVNECLLQYFHPQLPFGGSNLSGSGKAHGYYSFLEFSNQRSYLRQSTKWNAFLIAAPPYTKLKQRLVDFIIRWF